MAEWLENRPLSPKPRQFKTQPIGIVCLPGIWLSVDRNEDIVKFAYETELMPLISKDDDKKRIPFFCIVR